jgi:hypothetical protein
MEAKMKPLGELGGVVWANVELNIARVGLAQHLDGAGIKRR